MDRDAHLLPIAATFAAVGLLSLMDAVMKGAALAAGVFTATILRSAFSTAMIAPFWLGSSAPWPRGRVLRLHLLRGMISAVMALSFFFAITRLPIAEAIAISFVAPLIALYLARLFLGEQIRSSAIGASVLGFLGTLVIVGGRLGAARDDASVIPGLVAIGFSALLYAVNFIVIRLQSQAASPTEVTTFHGGVSTVVLALGLPWLFDWPETDALLLIACGAGLTVIASMLLAWAYARAEAQALVPMEYSAFLWAALFGWLFFAEQVTATTLAGTALIVAGCWLATRRPRTIARP